jgi:hypothetical protein
MTRETVYVVTDCELDGPVPGRHSLLSFASVAVTAGGETLGEFEATLERLEGAVQDAGTLQFWARRPEAYAAATAAPEPPDRGMANFVCWVRRLPGPAVFAAHPVALDGLWMDFYLRRFTAERILSPPDAPRPLFRHAPLCLASFAAGRLGWPPQDCRSDRYPPDWLGRYAHTHRAIDDARGYARLLATLMRAAPLAAP